MLRKVKKIDNIYYCVLSSSTTEQEVKMAEGFMRLLPLSWRWQAHGAPAGRSWNRHAKHFILAFIFGLFQK